MKNLELYEVRHIKDLKDMLNSSVELYGEKAGFCLNLRDRQIILLYPTSNIKLTLMPWELH